MVKRVVSLLAAVFMVCASSFSASAWDADSFVADSPNYYKMFSARMPSISTMAETDSSPSNSLSYTDILQNGSWSPDSLYFLLHVYYPGYDSIPGYPDIEPYELNIFYPGSPMSLDHHLFSSSTVYWYASPISIPDTVNGCDVLGVQVPYFQNPQTDSLFADFNVDVSSFGDFDTFEVSGMLNMEARLYYNDSIATYARLESVEILVDGESLYTFVNDRSSTSLTVPYTLISRTSSVSSLSIRYNFTISPEFSYQSGNYYVMLVAYPSTADFTVSVLNGNVALDGFTDEAQDSINQHDQIEADWVGQMDENFNSLDLDTASYPSGLVSGFQLLSGIFMDIWNGLGDLHLIFTIPLTLGIVLVLIGRISKAVSNRSGRAEEKGDNSA